MGFSVSASFAIIGATVLVAIELFAGVIIPDTSDIHVSFQHQIDKGITIQHTLMEISDSTVTSNGSNYDIFINLSNTGTKSLSILDCMVLVDGIIQSFRAADEYLFPLKNTTISVCNVSSMGSGRLKIVTKYDNACYALYSI